MKITNIRFERVEGLFTGCWPIAERQVGALDLYPEYRRRGVQVHEAKVLRRQEVTF